MGARSQQSSRKSQRKYFNFKINRHSIDLLMPNKRNNLDQWMESQLKV